MWELSPPVAKLVAPPQPLNLRDWSTAPAASPAAGSSQIAIKNLGQLEIEPGEGEVVRGGAEDAE